MQNIILDNQQADQWGGNLKLEMTSPWNVSRHYMLIRPTIWIGNYQCARQICRDWQDHKIRPKGVQQVNIHVLPQETGGSARSIFMYYPKRQAARLGTNFTLEPCNGAVIIQWFDNWHDRMNSELLYSDLIIDMTGWSENGWMLYAKGLALALNADTTARHQNEGNTVRPFLPLAWQVNMKC